MPFDHLVVVMMENHSFDNLLGAMSLERAEVDGLTFVGGAATNTNPGGANTPEIVTAFPLKDTSQGSHVSQTWAKSHHQINGGKMDGFVRSVNSTQPMGYYTRDTLPFAYSLASKFTVGNRWFSSLPGPTYPNRRFLLAGTAYGGTVTNDESLLDPEPPMGTILDLLSNHSVTWANYFSDMPMTAVIARNFIPHLDHHHLIDKFFEDCNSGKLPAVSFVDPRIGALSRIGQPISRLPFPFDDALKSIGAVLAQVDSPETEEDPQDLYYGERWAHSIVSAILKSPSWARTCLVYIYDEHGGYFDHVPPPKAVPPDDIPPVLERGDPVVGYDQYGPRVPAIVVSPYSKPGGVTNVVHDHTSVLATIEAKWNLPALTKRDAGAADIMDFLDTSSSEPPLLVPPEIRGPAETGPSGPVRSVN